MHIVMFSINPLFPDQVMGGAPKHLQNIALHLGSLGHDVSVLCTYVDSADSFHWQENVTVYPILRFHQPFPQPYAIPAYDMAQAVQDVADFLARADRFYMHDGEFLFPYVYHDIPTVISLRDNVYPETLLGGFLAQGAKLILISEYSRQYFLQTVGRFFPEMDKRIQVIHNGLDWQKFQAVDTGEIEALLGVDRSRPLVLHPHRPEESKGIRQTIAVMDLLVYQHGIRDALALAPKWLNLQLTPDLRDFYRRIEDEIDARGLRDNFLFHDWIPQRLMPQYFSMGAVTLSLGYFPESFGNAVYESLGCGTPTIAARISTHRELLPEDLIDKVDYGDVETVAQIAARIIRNGERTKPETLAHLQRHYGIERQLNAYADVILNAEKAPPMRYRYAPLDETTRYRLPVWCYRSTRGVYHDFYANYRDLSDILPLLNQYPEGFTLMDAESTGIRPSRVETLLREGYLVPVIKLN